MGNGMLHRGDSNTFKEKARIPHSQDMDMESMQLGCIIPRRILDKGKRKELKVISPQLIAESPQTPALDQHRNAILDGLDIGTWKRTGATLDTWILDFGSVEKGRTAYIHQHELYIVLIMTLDEAKRHGKGGRGPRQNIYFGQGWEERNGKYGILTDGKEGKARDEGVELCPVYIIAYWLFMPVHSGN
jgi:hypothetical protein